MSGGSFDYFFMDTRLNDFITQAREVRNALLEELGTEHPAVIEVDAWMARLGACESEHQGQLFLLFKGIEWLHSGDWGTDRFRQTAARFEGESKMLKYLRWPWLDWSSASGGSGGVPLIDPMKARHGLAWRRVYRSKYKWTPLVVVRVVRCWGLEEP
jgi:hypothetical protein